MTRPRVLVVMPAYNAGKTLEKTVSSMPPIADRILLCDDGSTDETLMIARRCGLEILQHDFNRGYGANQKTLYNRVRQLPCDIVAMVHPDNQYDTSMITHAVAMIHQNHADVVLGTRMATAKDLGMPWWKRSGNGLLSSIQRKIFHSNLSEFHSGLRVFRASLLQEMPYQIFSNDFVFDSQWLAWCFGHAQRVRELPTQCFYRSDVSSINFRHSLRYGLATLGVLATYTFTKRYRI